VLVGSVGGGGVRQVGIECEVACQTTNQKLWTQTTVKAEKKGERGAI